MKQNDLDFFRPLWRRVAVTVFVAIWTGLEWLVWRDELFRWMTLAALAYAVWTFFITFDKNSKTPGDGDAKPEA